MHIVYFQSGIGDARQCESCPSPGETTQEMGSDSMSDCSMYILNDKLLFLTSANEVGER